MKTEDGNLKPKKKLEFNVSKFEAEFSKLNIKNKALLKTLVITWMLICLVICCVYAVNGYRHGQILVI